MKGLIYRDFCLVKKNWIPVFCISVGSVIWNILVQLSFEYGNLKKLVEENSGSGELARTVIYYMGAFLMWLTKKTNSVYPASIAHSVNNNSAGLVAYSLFSEKIDEDSINLFQQSAVMIGYMLILAIIFTLLILKDSKKQNIPAET